MREMAVVVPLDTDEGVKSYCNKCKKTFPFDPVHDCEIVARLEWCAEERAATEREICEWIRKYDVLSAKNIADVIERGEYRKK